MALAWREDGSGKMVIDDGAISDLLDRLERRLAPPLLDPSNA
jgi:hypothetical protein